MNEHQRQELEWRGWDTEAAAAERFPIRGAVTLQVKPDGSHHDLTAFDDTGAFLHYEGPYMEEQVPDEWSSA